MSESLGRALQGRAIVSINYLSGRYTKHGPPEGHAEIASVLPQIVSVASCKGKFIFLALQNDWAIWNTLGMTGGWSKTKHKHSRAEFVLDDGSSVFFNDPRNFGTLKYVHGLGALQEKLDELGPDMLSEDVPDAVFIARMRKKNNRMITENLMDQRVICGVGNYLKSESLYFAGISPLRHVASIGDDDLARLNKTIKSVIRASYKTGGATIYTFQGFDGEKGEYTRRFAVYNQEKDPAGLEVTREVTDDGRTTFWVKGVQT